jgi:hypothetical protein
VVAGVVVAVVGLDAPEVPLVLDAELVVDVALGDELVVLVAAGAVEVTLADGVVAWLPIVATRPANPTAPSMPAPMVAARTWRLAWSLMAWARRVRSCSKGGMVSSSAAGSLHGPRGA